MALSRRHSPPLPPLAGEGRGGGLPAEALAKAGGLQGLSAPLGQMRKRGTLFLTAIRVYPGLFGVLTISGLRISYKFTVQNPACLQIPCKNRRRGRWVTVLGAPRKDTYLTASRKGAA